jgi:hypothetical protein
MNYKNTFLAILLLTFFVFAEAQLSTFNEATGNLLKNHVAEGSVDYSELKRDSRTINTALKALEKVDLTTLSLKEREALYINAYNLFIIKGIVNVYPIRSVKDVSKFFETKSYSIGKQKVSLNQLEKEILFKEVWDERLHFALVCGAVSCPPLSIKAFTAENTELMLRNLTKKAINDPSIVRLDNQSKTAYVSRLFDWYNADFTKNQSLKDYINIYRNEKIPADFKIKYMNYDWSLNGR